MSDQTPQELLKAFSIAMEVELQGLDAYLNFAKKTKDPSGKNMFIQLAMDEMLHYRILQETMKARELNVSAGNIEVKESIIQRIVPKLKGRDARVKGEAGLDQVNALESALEQERKAFDMFRGYYESATEPEVREIFRKLMDMEQSHYDIIQAELDNINETGFWFQIPEFDLED